MRVPFTGLASNFIDNEKKLIEIFKTIGRSGQYVLGPKVKEFETRFADLAEVGEAIAVGNGSDALFLTLKAYGIGQGDEVILPANSFVASAWAIRNTGAHPVFCDVYEETLNIDVSSCETKITSSTKAILAVHLTGRSADMRGLKALAEKYKLILIEDAAQAVGARYFDEPVGNLGDAAGFSLHPLKNLNVMGDGGVITTNYKDLADELRLLRNHGLKDRDTCVRWGYNSRLDELQAAIALLKLNMLEDITSSHRDIADFYLNNISSPAHLPRAESYEFCVFHNFIIQTAERNELQKFLLSRGVETKVHYPMPLHLQPCALELGGQKGDCPVAERLCETMLSLPIYPELKEEQLTRVVDSVNRFYAN